MLNSVKSHTSKDCLNSTAWNDETMINTSDLKVFNNNYEQKFDVIIEDIEIEEEKTAWILKVKIQNKSNAQVLHTYAGHKRLFKNLDFCLKFVQEYCSNANQIYIVLRYIGSRTIQVLDASEEQDRQ